MAPRRAEAWPAHLRQDADVRWLDPEGRFVHCRLCERFHHEHGGRTSRPVRMTAPFRPRAWELHKLRSRAHAFYRLATDASGRTWEDHDGGPLVTARVSAPQGRGASSASATSSSSPAVAQGSLMLILNHTSDTQSSSESFENPVSVYGALLVSASEREFMERVPVVDASPGRPKAELLTDPVSLKSPDNRHSTPMSSSHGVRSREPSGLQSSSADAYASDTSEESPMRDLARELDALTNVLASRRSPSVEDDPEEAEMMLELLATVREMQNEHRQWYLRLFRLQESTSWMVQQLLVSSTSGERTP